MSLDMFLKVMMASCVIVGWPVILIICLIN